MAASQVWHSGECFSPGPSRASRCSLSLSGDCRTPLISRWKWPTPGNHRVKSISGAFGVWLPLVVGEAWAVAALNGVKDAVLGPVAGVWLAFVGELLWIGFHFDSVLYFDSDAWGWGIGLRRPGGAHSVSGQARAGYG